MASDENAAPRPWKCPFCRMQTRTRLFGTPLCDICREQVGDFLLVSLVQVGLLFSGAIGGLFFVLDEVLLFTVLVVIKHKVPSFLDRLTQTR